jgi:hypothetical protein
MAQATSATHQAVGPSTPRAHLRLARGAPGVVPLKLRLARGPDAPLGETLHRSKGRTPPRAKLRLARGRPKPAASVPTPQPEH